VPGGGPSGAGRDLMREARAEAALDWPSLRDAARAAAASAYAPYSRLLVGAAALCDDGRVVTGCNVENASYGLGVCAEVTLAGQLRLTGGGRLRALACRSGDGDLLMPCGRCRQVLYEFGGPDCLVDTPRGPLPLSEVLPDAFGPHDLPGGAG
jgi:cytidine deaminase